MVVVPESAKKSKYFKKLLKIAGVSLLLLFLFGFFYGYGMNSGYSEGNLEGFRYGFDLARNTDYYMCYYFWIDSFNESDTLAVCDSMLINGTVFNESKQAALNNPLLTFPNSE